MKSASYSQKSINSAAQILRTSSNSAKNENANKKIIFHTNYLSNENLINQPKQKTLKRQSQSDCLLFPTGPVKQVKFKFLNASQVNWEDAVKKSYSQKRLHQLKSVENLHVDSLESETEESSLVKMIDWQYDLTRQQFNLFKDKMDEKMDQLYSFDEKQPYAPLLLKPVPLVESVQQEEPPQQEFQSPLLNLLQFKPNPTEKQQINLRAQHQIKQARTDMPFVVRHQKTVTVTDSQRYRTKNKLNEHLQFITCLNQKRAIQTEERRKVFQVMKRPKTSDSHHKRQNRGLFLNSEDFQRIKKEVVAESNSNEGYYRQSDLQKLCSIDLRDLLYQKTKVVTVKEITNFQAPNPTLIQKKQPQTIEKTAQSIFLIDLKVKNKKLLHQEDKNRLKQRQFHQHQDYMKIKLGLDHDNLFMDASKMPVSVHQGNKRNEMVQTTTLQACESDRN